MQAQLALRCAKTHNLCIGMCANEQMSAIYTNSTNEGFFFGELPSCCLLTITYYNCSAL